MQAGELGFVQLLLPVERGREIVGEQFVGELREDAFGKLLRFG